MAVQVLGQGEEWQGYRQKFESYQMAVNSAAVDDDSIVVFVDAYDVLFFPAVASIAQVS